MTFSHPAPLPNVFIAGSATTADPSPHPDFTFTATPGDLLRLQLSSGQDLYFEVTKCRSVPGGGTTLEALCEGEVLRIQPNGELTHVGYLPRLSDSWVKSYPTLQAALKNLRRQQESEGTLPSTLVNAECQLQLSSSEKLTIFNKFERVASLIELESQVASNPSPWCDGTAPEDPEPTPQETALLSAGELLAFLQGNKGVQLVQLELPFVPGSRVPFPLLRPFVLRLLQRAVEAKGAVVFPSTAPGGAGATSLVLAAKQQPFKAWGARLAEVGVQAALVADSPYYKMLIGKILGYKEPNIVHHIEVRQNI